MEQTAPELRLTKTHHKFKYAHKSNLKFRQLVKALEEQFEIINNTIKE